MAANTNSSSPRLREIMAAFNIPDMVDSGPGNPAVPVPGPSMVPLPNKNLMSSGAYDKEMYFQQPHQPPPPNIHPPLQGHQGPPPEQMFAYSSQDWPTPETAGLVQEKAPEMTSLLSAPRFISPAAIQLTDMLHAPANKPFSSSPLQNEFVEDQPEYAGVESHVPDQQLEAESASKPNQTKKRRTRKIMGRVRVLSASTMRKNRERMRQYRARMTEEQKKRHRDRERERKRRQRALMSDEKERIGRQKRQYKRQMMGQCDPFKEFRSVMTDEQRMMISHGLSDEQRFQLVEELQELKRKRQREATRLRRAKYTEDQKEAERRRNRERKRMVRQNPLLEFRQLMTEEQKVMLMQPDLTEEKKNAIINELIAIRKWIQREQARERRAHLSDEQREDVRKRSREYKRRARSNPLQGFHSVMSEQHYNLLQQDLDETQKQELLLQLIDLRKAKRREATRARRASFSPEQKEEERRYSREYKRMQRLRAAVEMEKMRQDEDVALHIKSDVTSVQPQELRQEMKISGNELDYSNFEAKREYDPMHYYEENVSKERLEKVRLRNRERQRIKRAMQTEEEREEERKKNRERNKLRRMKLAEEARRNYLASLQNTDVAKENEPRAEGVNQQNIFHSNEHLGTSQVENKMDQNIQLHSTQHVDKREPYKKCPKPDITLSTCDRAGMKDQVTWLSEGVSTFMRETSNEARRRNRANLTEERKERERARNRERQRMKRLMQSPEERAEHAMRQKMLQRQRRQDPAYREMEREREKERKRLKREFPWYRARESGQYRTRKARHANEESVMSNVETAVKESIHSNEDPDQEEEQDNTIFVDVNVAEEDFEELNAAPDPHVGYDTEDTYGKIASSVFGLHRIQPLTTLPVDGK